MLRWLCRSTQPGTARAVAILPLLAAQEECLARLGAEPSAPSHSCSAHMRVLRDGAGEGAAPQPPRHGVFLVGLTLMPRPC